MYTRQLSTKLIDSIEKMPVVTILGPRQSGKTTLAKMCFPEIKYYNLEDPETRLFAIEDPRGFLGQADKMILDEIQKTPELLSYIQVMVDENKNKKFILTGSHQLLLNEKISQSLAGRTRILTLLPLSFSELYTNTQVPSLDECIINGFYPRIHNDKISPQDWIPSYIQTYVEKDVRQITNIGDQIAFDRFLHLSAGRAGQLLDFTSLGKDIGITSPTVKSWISILCSGYICFMLKPFYTNINKRHIKTAKLFFYDTALLCNLLGIKTIGHLNTHPLRGAIFENFIIAEFMKSEFNKGNNPQFYFYNDNHQREIDLIDANNIDLKLFEIKSGATFQPKWIDSLNWFCKQNNKDFDKNIIFTGTGSKTFDKTSIHNWEFLIKSL